MAFACVMGAGAAHAAGNWETTLQARDINGDGTVDAYYDTTQNITWLAVINAAAGSAADIIRTNDTSPYQVRGDGTRNYGVAIPRETLGAGGLPYVVYDYAGGVMTWDKSEAWADSLDVFGVTGWRLPDVDDLGTPGCAAGQGDCGQNVDIAHSQLAHLLQAGLGNTAASASPTSPNYGPFTRLPGYSSQGAFDDGIFWLGRPGATYVVFNGSQSVGDGTVDPKRSLSAWAVKSGDVPSIPEAGTLWLAALGLAGIGCTRARERISAKSR
ncbi:MAG: PEP-CTERM sorting domain-containing protein [Rubrivivax sp.]|nr:MAG: PEP-CTERM sorting domain-containing protein [Rubrivivax sp.]